MRIRRHERDVGLVVRSAARRAKAVQVILDVSVAKEADLVPALTRPKIAVRDIHVLHTQRTACGVRT